MKAAVCQKCANLTQTLAEMILLTDLCRQSKMPPVSSTLDLQLVGCSAFRQNLFWEKIDIWMHSNSFNFTPSAVPPIPLFLPLTPPPVPPIPFFFSSVSVHSTAVMRTKIFNDRQNCFVCCRCYRGQRGLGAELQAEFWGSVTSFEFLF